MTKKAFESFEHLSLLEIIVAVHCVYSENKPTFDMFSELCFEISTIIAKIIENNHSQPDIKVFYTHTM